MKEILCTVTFAVDGSGCNLTTKCFLRPEQLLIADRGSLKVT